MSVPKIDVLQRSGVLTVRAFDLKKSSTGEELRSSRLVLPPGMTPECCNTKSALLCLDREKNTLYHVALPLPEKRYCMLKNSSLSVSLDK